MSEEDYSNRELDEKFKHIREALGRIEVQTTATNGKVRKLTIAIIAIGFFSAGLGLEQLKPILMLLI